MSSSKPSPQEFLAAAAAGTRVVVRYRIEGGLTDALGELVERTADACIIRTRRSDVVIPLPLVVAAKQVPPPPPRRGPTGPAPHGTCPPLAVANGHIAAMSIPGRGG